MWKIFNPNYDFLIPLCLYLVQKYEKNDPLQAQITMREFQFFESIIEKNNLVVS
jgi:hypothetical protein